MTNWESANRFPWILLALIAGCSVKTVDSGSKATSEKEFWEQWVLQASASQAVGHLDYSKLGIHSGCKDQHSIELRGTADEQAAAELVGMMSAFAPDHLVTVVATSERLAYVETRVNCAQEWLPGGLYAVFEFAQARTPGERRWQVVSVSRWMY